MNLGAEQEKGNEEHEAEEDRDRERPFGVNGGAKGDH